MEELNEEVVRQVAKSAGAEVGLHSCTGTDKDAGMNTQRDAWDSMDLGHCQVSGMRRRRECGNIPFSLQKGHQCSRSGRTRNFG